jgi:fibronectin type 3 domain-containing protein
LAYEAPVHPPAPVTDLTARGGDGEVRLSWSENPEADSYIVKRSNTSGGPYAVLAGQVSDTSFTDIEVENGTTYYYIVTAVNANGESQPSNEVSATPGEARAVVHITLETGLVKTYDWTKDEATRFADWFEDRADGFAPAYYKITTRDPANNTIRTEYLLFDKIVFLEIVEPDHEQ